VREQFEPRTLESFDPVTQELCRLFPATIHIRRKNKSQLQQGCSCISLELEVALPRNLGEQIASRCSYEGEPAAKKFTGPQAD
jgi:hypothetical protein